MNRGLRTSLVLAASAVLTLGIVLACAGRPPGNESPPQPRGFLPAPMSPGVYRTPDDTARAVGILRFKELEGGVWYLVDALPGDAATDVATDAPTVVVIANPDDLDRFLAGASMSLDKDGERRPVDELDDLLGAYVAVDGTLTTGASIRMAGPEIQAEDIRLASPTRKPPKDLERIEPPTVSPAE